MFLKCRLYIVILTVGLACGPSPSGGAPTDRQIGGIARYTRPSIMTRVGLTQVNGVGGVVVKGKCSLFQPWYRVFPNGLNGFVVKIKGEIWSRHIGMFVSTSCISIECFNCWLIVEKTKYRRNLNLPSLMVGKFLQCYHWTRHSRHLDIYYHLQDRTNDSIASNVDNFKYLYDPCFRD